MRIGIDARMIQGPFTGDSTYWRGLIAGLSHLNSNDEFFLYLDAGLPTSNVPSARNIKVRLVRAPSWRLWSAVAFPWLLWKDHISVAHVQYTIPPIMPCPVVTSIHDVSFKRHPEFFNWKDRFVLNMGIKYAAKRAFGILAISEHTKHEIVELYKVPAERVSVIYPGVDEQFTPGDRLASRRFIKDKYGISSPIILTVGTIQPRKNLSTLVKGFAKLKASQEFEHKLVVVGKYGWKERRLLSLVEELELTQDILFVGYVPQEDLPALYLAADVFVYPSVYEGFGLPPLEAMACGTPVITGNRSSLPEVVGEAGIMVDPYDPEAFALAMWNVLSSESLRTEMSQAGLKQAVKFSWDKMATEVLGIYREATSR